MFWPKLDSILLIEASTCHGIPYAEPACCQRTCRAESGTCCRARGREREGDGDRDRAGRVRRRGARQRDAGRPALRAGRDGEAEHGRAGRPGRAAPATRGRWPQRRGGASVSGLGETERRAALARARARAGSARAPALLGLRLSFRRPDVGPCCFSARSSVTRKSWRFVAAFAATSWSTLPETTRSISAFVKTACRRTRPPRSRR